MSEQLRHDNLPIPAAGLDLMIVSSDTARNHVQTPSYEFWFSTGSTWPTEIDRHGSTSEILVFLATCAEHAQLIYGVEPSAVFMPVPSKLLLKTLIDILEWHKGKILDDFHDPRGQYSVLNASRAWMYAEEQRLGSKAAGGKWVLEREPDNELVKKALSIRDGKNVQPPISRDIKTYLDRVLEICKSKLKHTNTPVIKIEIPEYELNKKPNYVEVGRKIDEVIEAHFSGRRIGLRYLSLQDHPSHTLDTLTQIIIKTGTDRYDPKRKMSVAHDFYSEKGVELFVMPVTVSHGLTISENTIADFWEGALEDRRYSLRIDLVVIYDLEQLEKIDIKYDDGVGEGDYKFRFADRKTDSVLGIIQIL